LSDYHEHQVSLYSQKSHRLADNYLNPETMKTLAWFSNNYYCLEEKGKDTLQWHDLRFGIMNSDTTGLPEYVFTCYLPNKEGVDIIQKDPSESFKNKMPLKMNCATFSEKKLEFTKLTLFLPHIQTKSTYHNYARTFRRAGKRHSQMRTIL